MSKKNEKKDMAAETKTARLDNFEPLDEIRVLYKKEFEAVRAKLKEPVDDDICLYRFLKGWKFDIEKTVAQMNATAEFRKQYDADAVRVKAKDLTQPQFPFYDKLIKCYPHTVTHKVDKQGQPISIECLGRTDPAMIVSLVRLDDLMQYHMYHVEHKSESMQQLSLTNGKIMRTCKIIDLSGLGSKHMHQQGLSYLRHVLHLTQDNYPEMLGNLYIVNAPWVFNMIWKIVKPWLNDQTLSKIKILGSNYKEVLLNAIDAENLPKFLGGKCECEGGCVAMKHPDADMTKIEIKSKGSETIKVEVPEGKSIVSWEFRSIDKNIGFKASFIPKDSDKPVEVRPSKVYDAHVTTVVDSYEAETPGTLVVVFDNSYSRWTAKTVLYQVSVASANVEDIHLVPQCDIEVEMDKLAVAEAGRAHESLAVEGEPLEALESSEQGAEDKAEPGM